MREIISTNKNIAYIVYIDLIYISGVYKKIVRQIESWERLGIKSHLIFVSKGSVHAEIKKYIDSKSNIHLINSDYILSTSYIEKYISRIFSLLSLKKILKKCNIDTIFIRQTPWFPFLNSILKRFKTIADINDNDYLSVSNYPLLKKYIYRYLRYNFFKYIDAITSVTPEIENYLHKSIPLLTLSNSTDINELKFKDKTPRGKRVIFMSTPNQSWQGVDKILLLAKHFYNYQFIIIGWESYSFNNLPNNVSFKGYISGKELDEELLKSDYAISPLALYRKNMNTTSAIKTVEYLSYNLPVIMSYNEIINFNDMVLKLSNNDENVNIKSLDKINKFFIYWKNKNLDINFLKIRINTDVIEEKRLDFIINV